VTTVGAAFVGCKISLADGERALEELAAAGLPTVTQRGIADVVVVHTCCVTAEAERKSRRLARSIAGTGKHVLVTGCAAALHPRQFDAPGVEVLERPDWAQVAAGLVGDPVGGEADRVTAAQGDQAHAEGSAPAGAGAPAPGARAGGAASDARSGVPAPGDRTRAAATPGARTRAVLKVQDGCAARCSYCVVRVVRGAPRSTPLDEALAAAARHLAGGCGELVLSGVDLGAWRDGPWRLPDMVAALAELPGLTRLRLSSLEPRHLDAGLLAALRHSRVARHLHVPLQSADDGVLRAMRRPYTFCGYVEAASLMRRGLGDCMLSTDVIVGYPTEDEAAFAKTLAALESGLFGRAHVFAFSPRPGTEAGALPPLPAAVVKERMARALAAADAAARAARLAALGRPADVLVEERRDGLWRGYSSEYIRYYLEGAARPGTLVHAVAHDEHRDGVKGRIA